MLGWRFALRKRVAGLLFGLCLGGLAFAADLEVQPGSVVRWPGEGIQSCSIGQFEWKPVDDACWFAIDLLTVAGPLKLERKIGEDSEAITVTISAYPYPEQRLQVSEKTVHLSGPDEERAAKEKKTIDTVWRQRHERRFHFPLAQPLADTKTGRSFGARRILNNEPRSPHSGIDYRASRGTPVSSVASGVVVLADEYFFGGKSVFINHGDELISMYMHLDHIEVEQGQIVDRGERVGVVGSTGRATGPHLHFALRWHEARIDPKYLFGKPETIFD